MPLSSAYVLVGISHICAEVKTFITIHQTFFVHYILSHKNSFLFRKTEALLLTRSPLEPLSPGLPVAPLGKKNIFEWLRSLKNIKQ